MKPEKHSRKQYQEHEFRDFREGGEEYEEKIKPQE